MQVQRSAQQPPEYLVVGRVIRPHGVRGELIVEALSPLLSSVEPDTIILLGDPPRQGHVLHIRPHRDRFLVTLSGCTSREAADAYRGLELRLPFEQAEPLPEGEFYYWQILGLQVFTLEGKPLGEIVQILETGANDVYVARDDQGKEVLIPAIQSVIKKVDLDAGKLQIEPIPGLLEE